MNTKEIKVRFHSIDSVTLAADMLVPKEESYEIKWKLLKDLWGIERNDDLVPVEAWIKYLCEINDLPFTLPAPEELQLAISLNEEVAAFAWFLA